MSARLQRIHAILRAGNVPCGLTSRPGIGTVLHAGTPEHGPWDVLVRDTGDQLLLHHAGGVDELPHDVTDSLVADVVKVRVVQAWADRGDPEARALIARLDNPSQPDLAAYRDRTTQPRQQVPPFAAVAFVDPLRSNADPDSEPRWLGDAHRASRIGSFHLVKPVGHPPQRPDQRLSRLS